MADITPPTISITSTKSALKSGETALITFTLSEVATDFVLSDITVSGGTLSNFSGSGATYSATFAPIDNSNAAGSISVGNYKFSDPSGNANEDGNDSNNRVSLNIDTAIPTVSISSSKSIFGINETALVNFKLSEPSTDFTLSDVSVSGGVLTNFTGSGANYTATFTPKSGVSTSGSITVGINAFSDTAGNFNNLSSAIGVYLNTNSDPQVPKLNWARLLGTSETDSARAITTGLDGYVYVSGDTLGKLFDGQSNIGYQDVFVSKYSQDGTRVWTKILGSSGYDYSNAISTGVDGSIYVGGRTTGFLDGQIATSNLSAFVTKFNPDGTKVWTRLLGLSGYDYVNGISTGTDGSIYLVGQTGAEDGRSNSIYADGYVTKYDQNGTKDWTLRIGTSSFDESIAISAGQDGSIYIAGQTDGSLDGQANNGGRDAFITKYSANGTKVWTRLLGSNNFDIANTLTIGTDGAIYVGGYTYGEVFDGLANSGGMSGFISKFLPDGTKVWSKLLNQTQIKAIKIGQDGAIFAAGNTYGGSLEGQVAPGGNDAFVSRYETDGTKSWTRILGSTSSDNLYGLTVGTDGSLFLAGDTYSDLYGEKILGTPVLYSGKGSSGSSSPDAFLMNLSLPDNVPPQISISLAATSKSGPLKVGESVVINFAITEAVKDFVATDITVQGGRLTNFQGADKTYSATFTAISEVTAQFVSVGNGKFSDGAGNFNLDGADTNNTITIALDIVAPTIALSTSKSNLIAGESAILTFVLSEDSNTFSVTDVTVNGGKLSNFIGSGVAYAATFTPTDNITANGVVSVSSGVFTDSAGNANTDGSDANNTLTLSVDTVLPTIALSTSKTNLIEGDTATVTFTLSEASTTFTALDITITGGTISNFLGSGTTYTATFTPTANSLANGVISVASGVFTDTAGNINVDGADKNNVLNFTRVPTVFNETHSLSVIVDKDVLGNSAALLKDLKESITYTNGFITKHTVEYASLTFNYTQIDALIAIVTRDGEFTSEFTKEINDYLATELNITYAAAVKLLGAANIDAVILSVAGADGNFVG